MKLLARQLLRWKTLPILIGIALFVMPFFWYRSGEGDFGGDASRLFFYDSLHYLRYSATNTMNTINLPPIYWAPLLALFTAIQFVIGSNQTILIALFTGSLFAISFAAIYFIVGELVEDEGVPRTVAGILAGLFFVFSQIVVYSVYRYIPSFHGIAVYPLIFLLLLRYVRTKRMRLVFYAALVSFVFSVNFSFDAAPGVSAFTLVGGLLFAAIVVIRQQVKQALKGVAVLLGLLIGLQAYHWIPQIMTLLNTSSAAHALVFDPAGKFDRGLKYFQGNRPWVRLIYNMVGFHQYYLYMNVGAPPATIANIYTYGVKFLRLFLLIPLTVCAGMVLQARDTLKRRRVLFFGAMLTFFVATYLMTANVFGSYGVRLYESLFSIPGFSMFRSFYGVFAIVFMFVYALVFGFSLYYVFTYFKSRRATLIVGSMLSLVIAFGALPLITGSIVNQAQDQTNGVRVSSRIPATYEHLLRKARATDLSASVLSMPLNNFEYQMIAGENGGAYVGPAPFTLLAGRSTYGGFGAFEYGGSGPFRSQFFFDRIKAHDYQTIARTFSLMNIGMAVYNASPETYRDSFFGWPYSKEVWEAFPDLKSVGEFAKELGYTPVVKDGDYSLYHNAASFLPVLYTPRTVQSYANHEDLQKLVAAKDYDPRSAFFMPTSETQGFFKSLPRVDAQAPTIEFRTVSSYAYRIRVHAIHRSFPLVLSRALHAGWRLTAVPVTEKSCGAHTQSGTNVIGATSIERAQTWCASGRIVALGKSFISEEYNGTIQNQNLPARGPFSLLHQGQRVGEHVMVNNFANAWLIDLDSVRATNASLVSENSDGSFDMEFELLFIPVQSIVIGVIISAVCLVSVAGVGVFLLVRLRRRRKIIV